MESQILSDELNYLLENYIYENAEALSLRDEKDLFCVVEPSSYLVKDFFSKDSALMEKYNNEKGKITCYKLINGLDHSCEGCGIKKGSIDNASCWHCKSTDGTSRFVTGHTVSSRDSQDVRLIAAANYNYDKAMEMIHSVVSSRELLVRSLEIISDNKLSFDDKFHELLEYATKYYGANLGLLVLQGEHSDMYTYAENVDPRFVPKLSDFTPEILERASKNLTNFSACYLDSPESVKEYSELLYNALIKVNVKNVLLVPVFTEDVLTGFIILRNLTRHISECGILCPLAEVIANLESDVVNKMRSQKQLLTDSLTGLLNFNGFMAAAERLINAFPDKEFILCSQDVKNFKNFNDHFGYDIGDSVLCEWARLIKQNNDKLSLSCHINADQFIILDEHESEERRRKKFDNISKGMRHYCRENFAAGMSFDICSGVIVVKADDGLTMNERLNRASLARKAAKELTGANIVFYNEQISEQSRFSSEVEIKVDEAIRNNEIVPFYQPQMNLSRKAVLNGRVRAEALARWINPDGTIFARPDQFIPVLERTGQISSVDVHIFEQVCKLIAHLKARKIKPGISVNVSKITLFSKDFVVRYDEIRKKYGIDFDDITLEFTESISVGDTEKFVKIIEELKKTGFRISMDDFGSDYSSLNNLSLVDLDELKLDRAFFMNNGDESRTKIIVKNVLRMADNLDMETVAEGIENADDIKRLEKEGCSYIQGFAFAKPMPVGEFGAWIEKRLKK